MDNFAFHYVHYLHDMTFTEFNIECKSSLPVFHASDMSLCNMLLLTII